jgi:hypothetical protein
MHLEAKLLLAFGFTVGFGAAWILFSFTLFAWKMIATSILLTIASISYGYYRGAFDNVMSRLNQIKKMAPMLAGMIGIDLNSAREMFSRNNSKSAQIIYVRAGTKYKLNVPYDTLTSVTRYKKYQLIMIQRKNGQVTRTDITQQPGIPYLVSPIQMGAQKFILQTKDGKQIAEWTKHEIPNLLPYLK